MIIKKFAINACCGRTSIIYKTDRPLNKGHLLKLIEFGFIEAEHFTTAGILYVDNLDLTVTGPFGSDRLQVKCRQEDCTQKMIDFELLLQQLE